MSRWIRRLLLLAVIGAATSVVLRRRGTTSSTGTPHVAPESTWPPIEPLPAAASPRDPTPDWVAPEDGRCPEGFPIKANASSRIFHVPGGRFYDRTMPERCYATADAAERDGYRRAKA